MATAETKKSSDRRPHRSHPYNEHKGGPAPCNPYTQGGGRFWKTEPTAIFIVWDDWGGWYDHVQPWAVYNDPSKTQCTIAPNDWGCGYTSGFRVPFLVVSPYAKPGYVSGACGPSGCQNDNPPYQHDFGSVLAFTENNFGLKNIDQIDNGYADYNAPDWGKARNNIPLSDFFGSAQYSFTHINTLEPYTYFTGYSQYNPGWVPDGPDAE